MKKTSVILISILIGISWSFFSCNKDKSVQLGTINIQLSVVTAYENTPLDSIEVVIVNTGDNTEKKAKTNSLGQVTFKDVPAGAYNISASKQLTISLTLNAVENNVNLSANQEKDVVLPLDGRPNVNDFLIKELYTVGHKNYDLKVQFIELYNNTDSVLYADGLYFADLAGPSGSGTSDVALGLPLEEFVYAVRVARIPGTGKQYPIQPGSTLQIALNAINFKENFNPNNTHNLTIDDFPDLSHADFECYVADFFTAKGFTISSYFHLDNPTVPNIQARYHYALANNGIFAFNSYGIGLVIFRPSEAYDETNLINDPTDVNGVRKFLKIPVKDVIDGVDCLDNSAAGAFKRLPKLIDASFCYLQENGKANYSGYSLRRKVERTVNGRKKLKDTNNSSADFEAITPPTPRSF